MVKLFNVTESRLYGMKRVFELQICKHFQSYLLQQLFARVLVENIPTSDTNSGRMPFESRSDTGCSD